MFTHTSTITYTKGLTLKTQNVITKNDIINMCELLNNNDKYINLCKFEPEPIPEGGIVFKFKDDIKWYKSVRLGVSYYPSNGKWYEINNNVISEWNGNNDIIFDQNNIFTIF